MTRTRFSGLEDRGTTYIPCPHKIDGALPPELQYAQGARWGSNPRPPLYLRSTFKLARRSGPGTRTRTTEDQNGPVSLNRTDSFRSSGGRADHLRHNRKLSRYSFRLGHAGYDSGRATVQMGCNERLELSSRDSQSRGLPDSLKTP